MPPLLHHKSSRLFFHTSTWVSLYVPDWGDDGGEEEEEEGDEDEGDSERCLWRRDISCHFQNLACFRVNVGSDSAAIANES